jgi:hypothetical protein
MNFPYNLIDEFGVEKSIDFLGGFYEGLKLRGRYFGCSKRRPSVVKPGQTALDRSSFSHDD